MFYHKIKGLFWDFRERVCNQMVKLLQAIRQNLRSTWSIWYYRD